MILCVLDCAQHTQRAVNVGFENILVVYYGTLKNAKSVNLLWNNGNAVVVKVSVL